jgi:hypothetical protein
MLDDEDAKSLSMSAAAFIIYDPVKDRIVNELEDLRSVSGLFVGTFIETIGPRTITYFIR